MIYATTADMIARFTEREMIELTDMVNIPQEAVDVARVEVKLADAAAFVDGYIGQVYRLPLRGCLKPATIPGAVAEFQTPPVLTRLVCDLARYYLHDDLAPEHEVYRRYTAAVKELTAIANGDAQLACPWGGPPGDLVGADAQSGTETLSSFPARQLNDNSLRGYEGFR